MSVTADIVATLAEIIAENPGSLVHGANTYNVFVSFGPQAQLEMLPVGYDPEVADLQVLLRVSDIVGAGPAVNDDVTLGAVAYSVTGSITKTPAYWLVPLKKSA